MENPNYNEIMMEELMHALDEQSMRDRIRSVFGGKKKEEPKAEPDAEEGEDTPDEEAPEEEERYPSIQDYIKTGNQEGIKTNSAETINFISELATALGLTPSQLAALLNQMQRQGLDRVTGAGAGEEGEGREGPAGAKGDGEDAADADKGPFTPETPLSVMKRQKDLKSDPDGPAEQPIVGSLQQLGLSQRGAQMVAKSVGSYLKKRGLPVSESNVMDVAKLLINEAKLSGDAAKQARSFLASVRRNLNTNLKDDPDAQKKYLYKVIDVAKRGQEGLAKLNANLAGQMDPEIVDVVAQRVGSWARGALKNWGPGGFNSAEKGSFRDIQGQKAENAKKLRDAAKNLDPLGKVIARSLSDNYGNAVKDETLASLMADPERIAKLSARIKKILSRQLKRRGTDTSQIKNLMEMVQNLLESNLSESEMG